MNGDDDVLDVITMARRHNLAMPVQARRLITAEAIRYTANLCVSAPEGFTGFPCLARLVGFLDAEVWDLCRRVENLEAELEILRRRNPSSGPDGDSGLAFFAE